MNPENKNSSLYNNVVITTVVDGERVVIGEAKTVEATIERNERNEENKGIKPFSSANGFSGTLSDVTIDFDSPFMKKIGMINELNRLREVIKYANHSKKLDKAYKKYAELYEKYLEA